jgi:hypothetical protein
MEVSLGSRHHLHEIYELFKTFFIEWEIRRKAMNSQGIVIKIKVR